MSDELNDKIYMVGGYYYEGKYKSYRYTVSTNSWTYLASLYRPAIDCAAVILYSKHNYRQRTLYVMDGRYTYYAQKYIVR